MRSLATLFFMITLTGNIFSQDVDTTLLMEDIVISQNRLSTPLSETARSITILRKQEIESLPVLNVPELLQYAGGVDIRRRGVNGTQSDAGVRGGTFDHVLILINGAKMADPQTGHHMLNLPVSLEDIERIEIIKGPAARIYGQNAFSGVFNIITKINAKDDITVNASLGLASFETFNGDINVKIPTKHYDQSITFSRIGSEGYRYNTDYGINTIFYQGEIKTVGNGIDINAGYTDRKFGANGFYANEKFTEQYEEVTTSFISATTLLTSGNFTLKPRISWRNNIDEYVFLRDNPSFYMNSHTGNVYNGELHASYTSSAGITGVGVDLSRQTLSSNNLGERQRNVLGIFAEHRFTLLNEKLKITPGFYANKLSDYKLKIYPGIDISYEASNSFDFYATANWSDRVPTYTDLYYSSRVEVGNENLEAESATAIEVGIKINSKNSSLTLSAWSRKNKNLIDWVMRDTTEKIWYSENFSEASMRGFDIQSKLKLPNLLGKNRHVNLNLDYAYINAKLLDQGEGVISKYALENLRHQIILGGQFTILPKRLYLNSMFRYLDRVNLDNYTQLDMKLMMKTSSFDAYFGVQNVGNVLYRETSYVTMPGRWFMFGMKFKS